MALSSSGRREMLKEQHKEEIAEILARYPVKRSALLPLLYLAQREQGYVTESAMQEIAGILKLTPPQVYETATFYTMLNLKPVGTFHIQVCKSLMCALVGSDTLIGWIGTKLGIKPGETTADKLFTLSAVECLAACGTAPMMQINDDYYERLTEAKLDRILADLRANRRVASENRSLYVAGTGLGEAGGVKREAASRDGAS